ncbi:tRNA 5-hydroxyuridine modification protein YegQ [Bartonella sp. TP]|uniref:prephenate-dependent tRNA uridine(34) hydroxylase TrhP n=1 Tax=Bartonella sp. TP TaxID=3057550 RepID=UPI0025B1513E|nr:tRNA 5-hydroxyuridine modification protein YegQ [Bartonella sp. TP]WJW79642.1 tRNA 5-hydroxyuridine modification protein YegQ [Bartonella sp. TP]
MSSHKIVELLSPAGTIKAMQYAFAYGADAVYAGQPRYSLRVRNNEFDHVNLAKAIEYAHGLGKKIYVVVNIAPHNDKLKTFVEDIATIVAMSPDALIMSDPGLIMLVRQHFPQVEIHLSVQANAVNWATVKFWRDFGLTRVILSRELSLKEIEDIRINVPEIELEVFVHGALCMAYSGRCLLSGYINHRDANQGTCTNACRWKYDVKQGQENLLGEIVEDARGCGCDVQTDTVAPTLGEGASTSDVFIIKDPQRPDNTMSAFEDEHGTYIMNSKDLRAVQYVNNLVDMGVHSLKIEGRTKSHYYVARTAQVYRRAIDDAVAGRPFNPQLMSELEALANRGYTEGFLQRHKHKEYQNYLIGTSHYGSRQFVGEFGQESKGDKRQVIVKNRFSVGDELELMGPQGNKYFTLKAMENKKGVATDVAPGDGHIVYLTVPESIMPESLDYCLLMRCERT